MIKGIFILSVILSFYYVFGFNISPQPSYVFHETDYSEKRFFTKVRSSYFGYSIVMKRNSIFIGAPRAQTTLPNQMNINETGAIYKCNIPSKSCMPFVFDNEGNDIEFPNHRNKKDFQWLGATMATSPNNENELVVCAPNKIIDNSTYYFFSGVCYRTSNIYNDTPLNVRKLSTHDFDSFKAPQQGFSVHFTSGSINVLLMGAVGVNSKKGSVVYNSKSNIVNLKAQPSRWNLQSDSYFGYAISSGYFYGPGSDMLSIVASIPRLNDGEGAVYIFLKSEIKYKFGNKTLCDYFGYSLLVDDFNNDGWYDIAISAPLYSKTLDYENGAVHIYINAKTKSKLDFHYQHMLTSNYEFSSRFGTALGMLGDINQDGYNDIAIGAPYEENGAVYIYFGNSKGVSQKPSQRIAPESSSYTFPGFMFGHTIANSVDIDNNGYPDIAIGAPEIETVSIYKTYPVVKFIASLTPDKNLIFSNNTSMNLKCCFFLKSKLLFTGKTEIRIELEADSQLNRVNFTETNSNTLAFHDMATNMEKCVAKPINIHYKESFIFKKILINMKYKILPLKDNSDKFNENYAITDINDVNQITTEIMTKIDCEGSICYSDLQLQCNLVNVVQPYLIGSTRNITFIYNISNDGETAYLPKLNITIPLNMPVLKIPKNCDILNNEYLYCKQDRLLINKNVSLEVSFDTTNIIGTSIVMEANITSLSEDLNYKNNYCKKVITISEFSVIHILSKSNIYRQELENITKDDVFSFEYEIYNKGPTNINSLDIVLSMPLYFVTKGKTIPVIDFSKINITGNFNGKDLLIEASSNDINIPKPIEENSTSGIDLENNMERLRRDLSSEILNINSTMHSIKSNINLSLNRTLFFNCEDDYQICVNFTITVNFLTANNNPFYINISFPLETDSIEKILSKNKKKDSFVISPVITLPLIVNDNKNRYEYYETIAYIEIIKAKYITPLWIYIVSVGAGIIILLIFVYILKRVGFFRRTKKEELIKIKRATVQYSVPASSIVSPVPTEVEKEE